ncbi:MAG: phage holin family protein [Bacteroidales bacterium]|nr:phage holin family protein [Bacteroidales bacterium]
MGEFDSNRNLLDELYGSLKEYMDLRINEGKLSLTESLAILFSRLIVFVLAVITGAIAFAFFAFALSQWIGTLLHSQALGSLITGSIFLVAVIVLVIFRKRLFTDSMVKLLIGMIFKNRPDEPAK